MREARLTRRSNLLAENQTTVMQRRVLKDLLDDTLASRLNPFEDVRVRFDCVDVIDGVIPGE